jgi:hypothetical protein
MLAQKSAGGAIRAPGYGAWSRTMLPAGPRSTLPPLPSLDGLNTP